MVKATRQAFGEKLLDLGDKEKHLVVVSCDLSGATMTKSFGQKYPDRFFEFGIAEQNALSASAGLAMEGFRPFIASFGAFITGRYDQIRISCAYNNAKVVIVGTHAGLAIGKDGATQMGLEDVNLMRGIPGMTIVQPADCIETTQAVEYLARSNDLTYLRLCRQPQPDIHSGDYKFQFGKGDLLQDGKDITVFATGGVVLAALQASRELQNEIDVRVVNIHTIKPIDTELVLKCANETKGLFTVEDHNIYGGLGTAVAEVVAAEGIPVPVFRWGIQDVFGESGDPKDLYRKHQLDKSGLIEKIREFYKSKII